MKPPSNSMWLISSTMGLGLLTVLSCSERHANGLDQDRSVATADRDPHAETREVREAMPQIIAAQPGGDCPMTIQELELLVRRTNRVYVEIEGGQYAPVYVDADARTLYVWQDVRMKFSQIPGAGPISSPVIVGLKEFDGYRSIEVHPPRRFLRALNGSAELGYYEPSSHSFYRWGKRVTSPELARKKGFVEVVPSRHTEGAEYIRHVVDIEPPPANGAQ